MYTKDNINLKEWNKGRWEAKAFARGIKMKEYDDRLGFVKLMRSMALLDENWEAFNAILQMVPGGVFVYSAEKDEQFSFVSENMLSMLGYTEEEFYEKFDGRFSQMVYEEDRERVDREIWEQIEKAAFDTCFYRIEKRDGSLLWVHDEGHIVTDTNGKRWFYVVIVDITASVKMQRDLEGRNEELRAIIDNIPVSIIVFRKEKAEVSVEAVNGFLSDLTGVSVDAYRSMSNGDLQAMVHPDDRAGVMAFFKSSGIAQRQAEEPIYRFLLPGHDTYQWLHIRSIQVPQNDGTSLIYAVFTDATYYKEKEEEYERNLGEFMSVNPNTLCAARLNLTRNQCDDFRGATPFIEEMLRADTADELMVGITELMTESDEKEKFWRNFNCGSLLGYFKAGQHQATATYHMIIEQGKVHWVTIYFKMVLNPHTGDVEAIASMVDSEQVRREEEISKAIADDEYDAICIIDIAQETVDFYGVSLQSEYMLGRTSSAMSYDTLLHSVAGRVPDELERRHYLEDTALSHVLEVLEHQFEYVVTYFFINAKGKRRRKKIDFRYLNDARQELMYTRSDITAAFLQEEAHAEQLQQALLLSEQASERKTEFLGNVSHDMRTPLNAILGYNDLALSSDDPGSKDEYLEKIRQAGSTLLDLINDTLNLEKIETGKTTLNQTAVVTDVWVREAVLAVKPLMDKKHIDFVVDDRRVAGVNYKADPIKLKEIVINLLSNAEKFTPEGGRVEFSVECVGLDDDWVHDRIVVRDTGIGMSREFLSRLYEPFAQERTRETANIGGSGLGLAIVKRTVDLMGGKIDVESELGVGTTFTLQLDFERCEPDKVRSRSDGELTEDGDIEGCRVLLCEDNDMNAEIAQMILERSGAVVTRAVDGLEGYDRFVASKSGSFDFILMDIRMPVMDGHQAAEKIRHSSHPDAQTIPIIAMSAEAYDEDVRKSLAAGMNAHLAKPIDPKKLVNTLASYKKK